MTARTKPGFHGHGDHGHQVGSKAHRMVHAHTHGHRPQGAPLAGSPLAAAPAGGPPPAAPMGAPPMMGGGAPGAGGSMPDEGPVSADAGDDEGL